MTADELSALLAAVADDVPPVVDVLAPQGVAIEPETVRRGAASLVCRDLAAVIDSQVVVSPQALALGAALAAVPRWVRASLIRSERLSTDVFGAVDGATLLLSLRAPGLITAAAVEGDPVSAAAGWAGAAWEQPGALAISVAWAPAGSGAHVSLRRGEDGIIDPQGAFGAKDGSPMAVREAVRAALGSLHQVS